MPLFQSSVLKKYSSAQDQSQITLAYDAYKSYFFNPLIQENIRNSKEEQFQEGFLRELFVNILGYTINPNPDYNLTTELKNIKDAKKTDGAILKDGKALAVIELKGTDTKDLDKIRDQAFNYKNNQPDCVFVITSNFEKLRFYIHNAVDHEEFHLFNLDRERFELLWLLLEKENLLNRIPEKIKTESLLVEEQVTKKLYSDYSSFKQALWQDMCEKNPEVDELLLYKKSQKLLDRFLFIFFAEDKGLLPPNSISEIAKQWEKLTELDEYRPLYDRFKKYFGYMNTGRVVPGKAEIHAYNGGLFAPDALLDSLKIDDQLLKKHTIKLSEYDFDTEVDTNILGHIFEHSLNDIENVRAQLAGEVVDKSKTKRKKDGVFYTPKYITKYIVDNTVGKLCEEKKTEVKLIDEEFAEGKKSKKKRAELKDKLDTYRNWLLDITICDPACGSGAFLNQALEFLMGEHRYLDELESQLFGTPMVLPNVENHILERNIFGVDINEESVEIARLSLWLRTAKKGRKLSSLSSNIKVGNSLIDDPEVAGDLAFNWEAEFPQVFAKGGFDVVIGNPPYVFTRGNKHLQVYNEFIWKSYNYNHGKINYYSVFLELSLDKLLCVNGRLGFITPETFIRTSTYAEIRKYLINHFLIESISIYGIGVFANVTAETITMLIQKNYQKNNIVEFKKHTKIDEFQLMEESQDSFNTTAENRFIYGSTKGDLHLFGKIKSNKVLLGELVDVRNGIATKAGKNNYLANTQLTSKYKKLLEAPDLFRYGFEWPNIYINYDPEVLHRPRKEETFLSDKILIQRVSSRLICSIDIDQFYTYNSVNNLVLKDKNVDLKYILGILNSSLIDYFYRKNYSLDAGFTITVTKANLDSIPIPRWIPSNKIQNELVSKTSDLVNQVKLFSITKKTYLQHLQSKFSIEKPSTKLQHWPDLDFKGFLGELKKAKVKLSLSEEAEWMAYFSEQKAKALALQSDITRLDAEIDALVYELYGLTEEEIRIVEGGEG